MAKAKRMKAAKDYPDCNIKKGDLYWFAKIKTGPRSSKTIRQIEPIKRSQLTSSDYLSQLYAIEDQIAALDSMDSAQEIADALRTLGEEQREKFDNMPEGLQQGDTGQLLESRADGCETAASEIEDIISEWQDDFQRHDDLVEAYQQAEAEADDAEEGPDKEAKQAAFDEMDNPSEFDESEFIDQVQSVSVEG